MGRFFLKDRYLRNAVNAANSHLRIASSSV
jgi:hypothetical protein